MILHVRARFALCFLAQQVWTRSITVHTESSPKSSESPHDFGRDILEIWEINRKARSKIVDWIEPKQDPAVGGVDFMVYQPTGPNGRALAGEDLGVWVNERLREPTANEQALDGDGPVVQQADFISHIGSRLSGEFRHGDRIVPVERLKYLELGVAVLKTFHVQSKFFLNASLTALDLIDPNPKIRKRFWKNRRGLAVWMDVDLPAGYRDKRVELSRRNMQHMSIDISGYLLQYDGPKGNNIFYMTGDVFNKVTWTKLQKEVVARQGAMDLIFSDAFHSADAVVEEIDNMIQYGIINGTESAHKDFAMIWDDCTERSLIQESFHRQIVPKLAQEFRGRRYCAGHFLVAGMHAIAPKQSNPQSCVGWHPDGDCVTRMKDTCIFTTLDISGPGLGASTQWKAMDAKVKCAKSGSEERQDL